jgi:Tfp pilus assembly protein PilX
MKHFKNTQTGSALVLVIILTAVLFSVVSAYQNIILSEKRQILSTQNNLKAMSIAEAGLEDAFWQFLHNDAKFTGNGWEIPEGSSDANKSGSFTDHAGNDIGYYVVDVKDVNSDHPIITSLGYATGAGTSNSVTIKAGVKQTQAFNYALLAEGTITANAGCGFNSYNSQKNPADRDINGHIKANSSSSQAVVLGGPCQMNGDISTGPGGTATLTQFTGVEHHPERSVYDGDQGSIETILPITVPHELTSITNPDDLTVEEMDSYELNSGNYHYKSITVKDQGTLMIKGDVNIYADKDVELENSGKIELDDDSILKLYVKGDFSMMGSGSLENLTNDASKFMILGAPGGDLDDKRIIIKSGQGAVVVVNAPLHTVELWSTIITGAVICRHAEIYTGGVLYDEDLQNLEGLGGYEMTWWRRM